LIHLSCGGQVIFRPEENVWHCSCGKVFLLEQDVITDNQITERSDEEEKEGVEK
jgi:hypothetical protein